MNEKVEIKKIPSIAIDYNMMARGADLSNKYCLQYHHPHSTKKITSLKSQFPTHIIYKTFRPKFGHQEFLLEIVRGSNVIEKFWKYTKGI